MASCRHERGKKHRQNIPSGLYPAPSRLRRKWPLLLRHRRPKQASRDPNEGFHGTHCASKQRMPKAPYTATRPRFEPYRPPRKSFSCSVSRSPQQNNKYLRTSIVARPTRPTTMPALKTRPEFSRMSSRPYKREPPRSRNDQGSMPSARPHFCRPVRRNFGQ